MIGEPVLAEHLGNRKLLTVLTADVAGYSRLMREDEAATIEILTKCRRLLTDLVSGHDGRVVDTPGDNMLAVFDSPVEAIACAIEAQRALRRLNRGFSDSRRMEFRMGVNLSDVIVRDDGTIYGDGVNIAARLEQLAEPGGICLSAITHEAVKGKLDAHFADLGAQRVKNMADPIRVYRVEREAAAASPPAADASRLDLKPSIAVMPFENLSDDSGRDYLVDGIAEDLITALSRIRWLLVIARNSTFAYKGRATNLRQVARELAVRYIVEGSVRSTGDRLRISAQLVDAHTGTHIWADRFDLAAADLFDIQDEITETIIAKIEPELGRAERERALRKPTEALDAWDLYQRGLWHLYRFTAADSDHAKQMFEAASRRDPRFAASRSALAYCHVLDHAMAYSDAAEESQEKAMKEALAGLEIDDKDAMGHCALGRVYTWQGQFDLAIAEFETAIEINPNFALAHQGLGAAYTWSGRASEAVESLDIAVRLSPHDPFLWTIENLRALANIYLGDYESARRDAMHACRHSNTLYWPYATLASALGHLGRAAEAKAALDKLLSARPDFSFELWKKTTPKDVVIPENYFLGLSKAGLEISDYPPPAQ